MPESSTFVDFDQAWAEFEYEGFVLPIPPDDGSEFAGDQVSMPATMPAGYRLHMWRLRVERGDDADLSYGELSVAASFLFGRDRVRGWVEQRITEASLTTAVQLALAEYAQRDPDRKKDGPGKAPPQHWGPST